MPALDQLARIALAGGRRVAQILRAVAIHEDLAGDHAQVPGGRCLEERLDGAAMHGAEHHGGGRAIAQQLIQEELRNTARMRAVRKHGLGRKRVALTSGVTWQRITWRFPGPSACHGRRSRSSPPTPSKPHCCRRRASGNGRRKSAHMLRSPRTDSRSQPPMDYGAKKLSSTGLCARISSRVSP